MREDGRIIFGCAAWVASRVSHLNIRKHYFFTLWTSYYNRVTEVKTIIFSRFFLLRFNIINSCFMSYFQLLLKFSPNSACIKWFIIQPVIIWIENHQCVLHHNYFCMTRISSVCAHQLSRRHRHAFRHQSYSTFNSASHFQHQDFDINDIDWTFPTARQQTNDEKKDYMKYVFSSSFLRMKRFAPSSLTADIL